MRIVGWAAVAALCLLSAGCGDKAKAQANEYNTGLKELKIEDTEVGTGRVAEEGDTAFMMYRGTLLKDGKQFDANMDDVTTKVPYGFPIGGGVVIKGWDKGVLGMKEGGKRILEIPAVDGYGASGNNSIPPNADLKFEVELKYVIKKGKPDQVDVHDDKVGTGPAVKMGDTVTVHYVGTYLSGKQWDNSRQRGNPFTFPLKITEECMPGLIYGMEGMKVGGTRTIVLSPSMAFGMSGTESVQGNQPLKIVVELLKVNGGGA